MKLFRVGGLLAALLLAISGCSSSGNEDLDQIEAAEMAYLSAEADASDACYPKYLAPDNKSACLESQRTVLESLDAYVEVATDANVPSSLDAPMADCKTELTSVRETQASLVSAIENGRPALREYERENRFSFESTPGCDRLVDEQQDRSFAALDRQSEVVYKAMGIVLAVLLIVGFMTFLSQIGARKRNDQGDPSASGGSDDVTPEQGQHRDPTVAALIRIAASLERPSSDVSKVLVPLLAAGLGSIVTAVLSAFLS